MCLYTVKPPKYAFARAFLQKSKAMTASEKIEAHITTAVLLDVFFNRVALARVTRNFRLLVYYNHKYTR